MTRCIVSPIIIKRRLSAPGRRKSTGLELKPESKSSVTKKIYIKARNMVSPASCTGVNGNVDNDGARKDRFSSLTSPANPNHVEQQSSFSDNSSMKLRATARASIKSRKAEPHMRSNFRAPVRMLAEGETPLGFTCTDCLKFVELMRNENVKENVIQAVSRHRYMCEPKDSPANLWQPWEIDSSPVLGGITQDQVQR